MSEAVITSRANNAVRRARLVRDGKSRKEIFVEGVRLCEEALLAGVKVEEALATEKLSRDERGEQLFEELRSRRVKISRISEQVMNSLSATKATQGVILIAHRPESGRTVLENKQAGTPLIVIVHEMNNPSNAGAVVRTAEAAGATGLIATAGTTYLFSPKALRGAMGSSFRLPLWIGADFREAIGWCRERGIATVAASARAPLAHTGLDWRAPRAIVIGPEATGLTPEEIEMADESVSIPMREPVESLNAAVACGIILYEAARQRAEAGIS